MTAPMFPRALTTFVVAGGLVMTSLGAASAQQAPNAQKGLDAAEWMKICNKVAEDQPEICITARERRAKTGQPIAAVQIREQADKKMLVMAVPPAMLIKPGLQVRIDSSPPQKAQYSICYPNFCFAEMPVKPDYVSALKKGSKVTLTTINQQAKPVTFDISLAGFTAAYDGKPVDPKQLQAQQVKLQQELKKRAEEARKKLIEKQQSQATQ